MLLQSKFLARKLKRRRIRCKKVVAKNLKKTMLKKMGNQNGWSRPPSVDGIPGRKTLLLPANYLAGNSNVLWPGHHYTWQATVMFCGLVIIIKNFISINSRRPWLSKLISHLFQHGFFNQAYMCLVS